MAVRATERRAIRSMEEIQQFGYNAEARDMLRWFVTVSWGGMPRMDTIASSCAWLMVGWN